MTTCGAPGLDQLPGLQGDGAGGDGGAGKECPAREHSQVLFLERERRQISRWMVRGGLESHKALAREMEKFIFRAEPQP